MTKPQLGNDDVKRLADMAKIEVTEQDVENYKNDINNILGHLSLVNDAVVGDTNITGEGEKFFNYTRDDIPKVEDGGTELRAFSLQAIFDNMPNKSKDNQVKVSKVLKK
jgi:aspartyl/glutamyl-tRNA(Asn/Gln) amidotransferase C subunit